MLQQVKDKIHSLTNKLQIVLGYIEIDQCTKALPVIKETVTELRDLAKMVTRVASMTAKDAVVIAPEGAHIVRPSDVKIELTDHRLVKLPGDAVAVVPKEVVVPIAKKRKYKARGAKMIGSPYEK